MNYIYLNNFSHRKLYRQCEENMQKHKPRRVQVPRLIIENFLFKINVTPINANQKQANGGFANAAMRLTFKCVLDSRPVFSNTFLDAAPLVGMEKYFATPYMVSSTVYSFYYLCHKYRIRIS